MTSDRLSQLEELAKRLSGAAKSLNLYPASHPAFGRLLGRVEEILEALLRDSERADLGVLEGALILEGAPWVGPSDSVKALVDRFAEREIGGVSFLKGVKLEELRALLEVLGSDAQKVKAAGGAEEVLGQRQVQHVVLTSMRPAEEEVPEEGLDATQAMVIYNNAVGSAKKILEEARLGKVPSMAEARATAEGLVSGILKGKYALLALTMIKSYDEYLFHHSVHVGMLCIALGQALGLEREVLTELGLGGLLHDLGKVYWPDDLYKKPRELTPEEWRMVQAHPEDGVKVIERMGGASPTAIAVVREHHVRYDKKGYPTLEEGREPSFFGLIGGIADSYDAMTTLRPYQNAFEPSRALARMETLSETVFDPNLLEAFVKLLGIYPVGSLVRLSTGELALVTRPGATDISRPLVRVLFDRSGRRLDEIVELDLMERDPATNLFRRSILMAVDPATKNIDTAKLLAGEAAAALA